MNQQNFYLQPFKLIYFNLNIHGKISRINNTLTIQYVLQGELEKIYIPSIVKHPNRQNELWSVTCLEFFLGIKNNPHYWEFNLSPCGNWNIYRFDDYRQGMKEETAITSLPFKIYHQSDSLQLDLRIDLDQFIGPQTELDVAITSVVKDSKDEITYWALKHCGEKPDFHLRDSFLMELV